MIGLLLASLAMAEPHLPEVTLTALDGEKRELPASLDRRSLVFVSFSRAHSKDLDTWRDELPALMTEDTDWFSIAVTGEVGRTTRWIVTTAMKGSYDAETKARTYPWFQEGTPFVTSLELAGTEELAVLVIDEQTRVLWSHSGPLTPEALAAAKAALVTP